MILLTFTVRVEVSDYYGEKRVPYLLEVFNQYASYAGKVRSVQYENWLTDKNEALAEGMEYTAWVRGETDL